jgi:hypothetical protein
MFSPLNQKKKLRKPLNQKRRRKCN